ncbi:LysR family transcriptional regulator [Alteraurantiacibacter aquimixticola]|uniref:LysR family transcriptional regulator n=1 Tax=Alteraurantiacibacter aquimixticola TaxID=2489173 RepID=A0A4T3F675_9SPHN|nr:LysR family transcriptional regulator [Alteraurantiacibacter aquimixticola]TIX51152.1 LysR family transcriptional regulator [Alteraurantiacibacter aquimixticola]
MAQPGTPTFDQLRIFMAVVEAGSFAGAGRKLNRAVSVISYGIENLEAQLGLKLFIREGTKKPVLTEAGHAILAEAQRVGNAVDGLRARTKGLLDGLEAEVTLVVDVFLPSERLANVLNAFAKEFPTVSLRLHVETLGAVAALVLDGRAGLGVAGQVAAQFEGLERHAAGSVALVPVAAPGHPLAQLAKPMPGAAREHIQLVLADRSTLTAGRDFAVASPRNWRLADLGAKHHLLKAGLGWGNMPLPMVEADLEQGCLVRLDLPDAQGGNFRFSTIHRADSPPGPAASWLKQRFIELGEADGQGGLPDV